jgi:hypothetical protein
MSFGNLKLIRIGDARDGKHALQTSVTLPLTIENVDFFGNWNRTCLYLD